MVSNVTWESVMTTLTEWTWNKLIIDHSDSWRQRTAWWRTYPEDWWLSIFCPVHRNRSFILKHLDSVEHRLWFHGWIFVQVFPWWRRKGFGAWRDSRLTRGGQSLWFRRGNNGFRVYQGLVHPWLITPVWRPGHEGGPQTRITVIMRWRLRWARWIDGEAVGFCLIGRTGVVACWRWGRRLVITNWSRFTVAWSAIKARRGGFLVAWLRGAVVSSWSILVGGARVVAHGLLVARLIPDGLGGRGLLVVWGPLFVVMRHTVVVVHVRVGVVRLWFRVAASIVSVRRVVVLVVWLFVLVRRLVAVAHGLLQTVVDSHRVLHIVQIFLVHLWRNRTSWKHQSNYQ